MSVYSCCNVVVLVCNVMSVCLFYDVHAQMYFFSVVGIGWWPFFSLFSTQLSFMVLMTDVVLELHLPNAMGLLTLIDRFSAPITCTFLLMVVLGSIKR